MGLDDEFIDREQTQYSETIQTEPPFDINSETQKPIIKAPKISSTNGLSLRLVGKSSYHSETKSYITTLYQTFAYIPICPMRRFRVREKGSYSKWNTYHQLYEFIWEIPLTKDQQTHKMVFYLISATAIIGMALWVIISIY